MSDNMLTKIDKISLKAKADYSLRVNIAGEQDITFDVALSRESQQQRHLRVHGSLGKRTGREIPAVLKDSFLAHSSELCTEGFTFVFARKED